MAVGETICYVRRQAKASDGKIAVAQVRLSRKVSQRILFRTGTTKGRETK